MAAVMVALTWPVRLLALDLNFFTTGSILMVDGGLTT